MTNKKYTATDGHKYSYHYIEKTDKQEEVQEVRLFPQKSPSPFFRDFANTTKGVFEEINSVDLPAANSLTQHTVSCRNAANMVQSSPAFKDYGSQIASGLRDFGEKITEAGRNLQKLYNKGSSVYKSFDHEIEAMMNRLKMNQKKGETKYFKNKINKLINKIKDFRELVEKTQSSIHNAEEIRHDTEGYIMNGLREARKYVSSNSNEAPQHSVDLSEAQKELLFVSELLDHLKDTAIHLDRIRKTLLTYEDKLLDVEAELSSSGDDDDDVFEVTKEDLKYLKQAVDVLKSTHYKFSKLSD
ncbi:hypothetical protein C1645_739403 [Glomus cerebriforme]|uniref:Uncharacterized protein n=1 Tax=Glomus cerebriforme TaxID=658196 RepID=A0A397SU35_9GLOM|nr:hypothetical protein C1645_739403 [Glomus cerebriforme]